jgi:ribonuclease HI
MITKPNHNRRLPLSQKAEDAILRNQMQATEKIQADQTLGRTAASCKSQSPVVGPTSPDASVVHVYIHMQQNPGPGAYAYTVQVDGQLVAHKAQAFDSITQPRLELTALSAACTHLDPARPAVVRTTAQNPVKQLASGQVGRWQQSGFRRADGECVANSDVWQSLLASVPPATLFEPLPKTSPEFHRCTRLADSALSELQEAAE